MLINDGSEPTDDLISVNNKFILKLYPLVNEKETPIPKCWSSKDKFNFIGLSQNRLTVHYKGIGKTHKDAASIRTAHPIPAICGIYYYEVKIVSKGRDGYMGIGLSTQNVSMNRLPGWDKHSYGYHGDDGRSFCSSGTGQPYGPTFTTNDIVGCGVNFVDNSCFYTKNGIDLGIAFQELPPNLYPTIGLQTMGETISTNFGQKPFLFDIYDKVQELKTNIKRKIFNFNVNNDKYEWGIMMEKVVSNYLINQGYTETAKCFNEGTTNKLDINPNTKNRNCVSIDWEDVKNRQKIVNHVLSGEMGLAIDAINVLYPSFFISNIPAKQQKSDTYKYFFNFKHLLFKLKCRQFVEIISGTDDSFADEKSIKTNFPMHNTSNNDCYSPNYSDSEHAKNFEEKVCLDNSFSSVNENIPSASTTTTITNNKTKKKKKRKKKKKSPSSMKPTALSHITANHQSKHISRHRYYESFDPYCLGCCPCNCDYCNYPSDSLKMTDYGWAMPPQESCPCHPNNQHTSNTLAPFKASPSISRNNFLTNNNTSIASSNTNGNVEKPSTNSSSSDPLKSVNSVNSAKAPSNDKLGPTPNSLNPLNSSNFRVPDENCDCDCCNMGHAACCGLPPQLTPPSQLILPLTTPTTSAHALNSSTNASTSTSNGHKVFENDKPVHDGSKALEEEKIASKLGSPSNGSHHPDVLLGSSKNAENSLLPTESKELAHVCLACEYEEGAKLYQRQLQLQKQELQQRLKSHYAMMAQQKMDKLEYQYPVDCDVCFANYSADVYECKECLKECPKCYQSMKADKRGVVNGGSVIREHEVEDAHHDPPYYCCPIDEDNLLHGQSHCHHSYTPVPEEGDSCWTDTSSSDGSDSNSCSSDGTSSFSLTNNQNRSFSSSTSSSSSSSPSPFDFCYGNRDPYGGSLNVQMAQGTPFSGARNKSKNKNNHSKSKKGSDKPQGKLPPDITNAKIGKILDFGRELHQLATELKNDLMAAKNQTEKSDRTGSNKNSNHSNLKNAKNHGSSSVSNSSSCSSGNNSQREISSNTPTLNQTSKTTSKTVDEILTPPADCLSSSNPNSNFEAAIDKDLEDAFSLLAYSDPWKSPVKYLLNPQNREPLAQDINSAILYFRGDNPYSNFDLISGQIKNCLKLMSQNHMGHCAFIDMSEYV